MKKVISTLIFLFALSGMLLFDSCKSKSDDPGPATLTANAGADQTAAPFTTVTLDGSASTGEGTINYQWTYNGGVIPVGDLALLSGGGTEATATFIPPKNGPYNFTLRITQGSQFSEDQVTVTVDGVISLSGTLAENLVLKDIEPNPTKPDYRITSDYKISPIKSKSLVAVSIIIHETLPLL